VAGGRYVLHTHGEWPDVAKLLEMYQRHQKAKKVAKTESAVAWTVVETVD
jgi:hypothetical protein